MKLPGLPSGDSYRRTPVTAWGGVNYNEAAADGEIADCRNISSREYPLIATRALRYKSSYSMGIGVPFLFGVAKKAYWGVVNTLAQEEASRFYYNDTYVGIVDRQGVSHIRAVVHGDCIYILPQKQYLDENQVGSGLQSMEAATGTISLVVSDGTLYGEAAAANMLTYTGDLSTTFRAGDAITIEVINNPNRPYIPENNKTVVVREIEYDSVTDKTYLRFYENTFTLNSGAAFTGSFKLSRTVPDMDYVCECNNRLWGCKGDTIYASKLGDPLNWNVFDGLASDSWATTTGTTGKFTGCVNYAGTPVFFKEDRVVTVAGDEPSNYSLQIRKCPGIIDNGDLSACEINGSLYYLSVEGVCAWSGGYPSIVSAPLGIDAIYAGGHAGTDGSRYYLSVTMMDDSTASLAKYSGLLVYDTRFGTWHHEKLLSANDEVSLEAFFAVKDDCLYMLTADYSDNMSIWMLAGRQDAILTDCTWAKEGSTGGPPTPDYWVEFADFYSAYSSRYSPSGSEAKKGAVRILMRVKCAAAMTVKVSYDGKAFETMKTIAATSKTSVVVPLIVTRHDHFRLRLEGTGEAIIYSIAVEKYGGEYPVDA